jgi:hypothetical protein
MTVLVVEARALSVIERTFPELVERADTIVVGKVLEVRNLVDGKTGYPYREVVLGELTVLKGSPADPLVLRFSGGSLPDGRVLSFGSEVEFETGERAVLFVAGNRRDMFPLVGVGQGRFRVVADAATGQDRVLDVHGAPVASLQGSRLRVLPGAPSTTAAAASAMSLQSFTDLIQKQLDEGR